LKFVDEYRDADAVRKLADRLASVVTRPWTIMEICGGQTHAIVRFGIDELLPDGVTLVHGPGCPVCVTSAATVDTALDLAARPDVIFCSFGDMLRVPGSKMDLLTIRAGGGDVRTVYSPMDAVGIAKDNPEKKVVFFAIGFETTAPTTAMAVYHAAQENTGNFLLLVSHVLVIPAMEAILSSPESSINGFLAAGHVCTITGYNAYHAVAEKYRTPIIVTGFEPLDLMRGIYACVRQLESGKCEVDNQYARAVRPDGNMPALNTIERVFEICDREWRGLGTIPNSGLKLKKEYADHDAELIFNIKPAISAESSVCISGRILQGAAKPPQCPAFGKQCTPEHPLGATMVSSEGACAAYYKYRP
jgi:hydrogenase expression/formation protein HypD